MSQRAAAAGSSKAERAYRTLKGHIEDGTYGPGSRLVLDQLARDMTVSPVPVREAVRRLEAEGYVVFERNVGARVASIDPADYANSMQVLAVLEGSATALAAAGMTPDDIGRAREVNERLKASLDGFDPVGFTRLNHEFHQVLCGGCTNPHLRGLIEREWGRLAVIRRSTFSFVPGRAAASVEEHGRILSLIASRAAAPEIERTARAHKLATLDAFLSRTGGRTMTDQRAPEPGGGRRP